MSSVVFTIRHLMPPECKFLLNSDGRLIFPDQKIDEKWGAHIRVCEVHSGCCFFFFPFQIFWQKNDTILLATILSCEMEQTRSTSWSYWLIADRHGGGGGTNRLIDSQTNMQAYRKRGRQYHGGLCYKYTELWIDKVQVSQRRVRIVDWMWLTARSQHAGVSTLHVCQIMAACVCLCVKH